MNVDERLEELAILEEKEPQSFVNSLMDKVTEKKVC